MGNDVIGTAYFKIELDVVGVKDGVKEVNGIISSNMEKAKKSTSSLSEGLANLTLGVTALKQSFSGLSSGVDTLDSLASSYNQYQASMNGVASVARSTSNSVAESMQVVRDATANGLVSKSDAASAVKNLELYGLTAQQAGEMIKAMTDAAVYNRQETYSLSEAVRVTTEGIRMENSVLSDAGGITKNIAKMHEEYAAQIGKSTKDLTDAEKAQAVYNGVLAEASTYLGDADRYSETLAGSQSKLSTSVEEVKIKLGSLMEGLTPIIGGLADWISQNQELVIGLTTFAGILIGGGGLILSILAAVKAVNSIKNAILGMSLITRVASGSLLALGVAVAGIVAATAATKVIGELTDAETDLEDGADGANSSLDTQGKISEETAKKIAKLQNSLDKLIRDYERDLKQIAVNHEENLLSLNKQIEEANIDYRRAIDERMADFNVSLAKQERSHEETMDELRGQLEFLQRYNNDYNKQKLAQVQFALAKEQKLYEDETAKQKAEIELQNENDRLKLEEKLRSLQQELDDEKAFLEKHRDEINGVRHVMLLDEIELLNERFEEQKKDYQRQIIEAKESGSKIGSGLSDAINEGLDGDKFSKMGEQMGKKFIDGFFTAIEETVLGKRGGEWDGWFGDLGKRLYNLFNGNGFDNRTYNYVNGKWQVANSRSSGGGGGGNGFASGGYTGRGAEDEIAGIVHRGEYVVPASQVNQTTGEPKIGTTQNITINLSGTFATSASERRKVAEQIAAALGQVQQARLA